MAPPILVDTTRLLTRVKHAAPTGIDRIDLAYARHFLRGHYRGEAIAATLRGMRRMPEPDLTALFDAIARRWSEDGAAGRDPVLTSVRTWLAAPAGTRPPLRAAAPARGRFELPRIPVGDLARMAGATRWAPAPTVPANAVYLHTSHLRLDRPELFAWLGARPDVRALFFVHDIIPIEHPEYGVPGEAARHRIRMKTVSDRAHGVIVGSHTIARTLAAYFQAEGLRVPPIAVSAIGVEPIFAPAPPSGETGGRPYFVVCSTIEARKNHLLLLQIWRDLAASLGAGTPALVIVGRRGWESENVIDLLERCPAMQEHVIEAAGLSTPGLVDLMRGARAVLMPSFAEGYGIPVVEALALGVPVIASDLPVHREIAGGHARLLHPLDGIGWRDAVLARTSGAEHATAFRPPRWEQHFRDIDALVAAL